MDVIERRSLIRQDAMTQGLNLQTLCASHKLLGLLVTAVRPHTSQAAATAKTLGSVSSVCKTCWALTTFAVKIETKGTPPAPFPTFGPPLASSRSTRLITPTISNPNS